MKNNVAQLYREFRELAEKGNDKEAEKFLADHIDELPEEVKQEILLTFFQEGLRELAVRETALKDMKEEMFSSVEEMGKAKRVLEDKKKAIELQEKME